MAVFVAAADESDGPLQTGPFVYGGFVAPTKEWTNAFALEWERRVLNVAPVIEFFHMTEMRNERWQREHGFSTAQANQRIAAAVSVIGDAKGIRLVRTLLDGGHFRDVFRGTRVARTGLQPGAYQLDPDYIGFLGFARGALEYVKNEHPDAERVDFVIERKQRVSHYMPDYLDSLESWLRDKNRHDLLRLVGELIPGEKSRVPLQAADLAMWHIRRHEANEADEIDIARLRQMFEGRLITLNGMTNEEISGIAERVRARAIPFQTKSRGGAA